MTFPSYQPVTYHSLAFFIFVTKYLLALLTFLWSIQSTRNCSAWCFTNNQWVGIGLLD